MKKLGLVLMTTLFLASGAYAGDDPSKQVVATQSKATKNTAADSVQQEMLRLQMQNNATQMEILKTLKEIQAQQNTNAGRIIQ